jgi:hypothetical protein
MSFVKKSLETISHLTHAPLALLDHMLVGVPRHMLRLGGDILKGVLPTRKRLRDVFLTRYEAQGGPDRYSINQALVKWQSFSLQGGPGKSNVLYSLDAPDETIGFRALKPEERRSSKNPNRELKLIHKTGDGDTEAENVLATISTDKWTGAVSVQYAHKDAENKYEITAGSAGIQVKPLVTDPRDDCNKNVKERLQQSLDDVADVSRLKAETTAKLQSKPKELTEATKALSNAATAVRNMSEVFDRSSGCCEALATRLRTERKKITSLKDTLLGSGGAPAVDWAHNEVPALFRELKSSLLRIQRELSDVWDTDATPLSLKSILADFDICADDIDSLENVFSSLPNPLSDILNKDIGTRLDTLVARIAEQEKVVKNGPSVLKAELAQLKNTYTEAEKRLESAQESDSKNKAGIQEDINAIDKRLRLHESIRLKAEQAVSVGNSEDEQSTEKDKESMSVRDKSGIQEELDSLWSAERLNHVFKMLRGEKNALQKSGVLMGMAREVSRYKLEQGKIDAVPYSGDKRMERAFEERYSANGAITMLWPKKKGTTLTAFIAEVLPELRKGGNTDFGVSCMGGNQVYPVLILGRKSKISSSVQHEMDPLPIGEQRKKLEEIQTLEKEAWTNRMKRLMPISYRSLSAEQKEKITVERFEEIVMALLHLKEGTDPQFDDPMQIYHVIQFINRAYLAGYSINRIVPCTALITGLREQEQKERMIKVELTSKEGKAQSVLFVEGCPWASQESVSTSENAAIHGGLVVKKAGRGSYSKDESIPLIPFSFNTLLGDLDERSGAGTGVVEGSPYVDTADRKKSQQQLNTDEARKKQDKDAEEEENRRRNNPED